MCGHPGRTPRTHHEAVGATLETAENQPGRNSELRRFWQWRQQPLAKNKARFAESFIGEYPKPPHPCPGWRPVIFLGFRSLKKAATPSEGALRAGSLGASGRPPDPLAKGI